MKEPVGRVGGLHAHPQLPGVAHACIGRLRISRRCRFAGAGAVWVGRYRRRRYASCLLARPLRLCSMRRLIGSIV